LLFLVRIMMMTRWADKPILQDMRVVVSVVLRELEFTPNSITFPQYARCPYSMSGSLATGVISWSRASGLAPGQNGLRNANVVAAMD
jgi:hypothetical protein